MYRRIRELREDKDLTQTQIAAFCLVHSAFTAITNGVNWTFQRKY